MDENVIIRYYFVVRVKGMVKIKSTFVALGSLSPFFLASTTSRYWQNSDMCNALWSNSDVKLSSFDWLPSCFLEVLLYSRTPSLSRLIRLESRFTLRSPVRITG